MEPAGIMKTHFLVFFKIFFFFSPGARLTYPLLGVGTLYTARWASYNNAGREHRP